jgi:peptidyl-prolyl cis-trans isomerase SurA
MMWFFSLLCFAVAAPVDRIAAVVNAEVITISEVYDTGSRFIIDEVLDVKKRREAELMVLESLITQKLIDQELQRIGMDVTEEELKRSISDIARSNKLSLDELKSEITKSGMEWGQYKSQLEGSIRQMKFNQVILQPRISINEDALLDRYRRSTSSIPEKTRLALVFFAAPAQTPEEIAKQIPSLSEKISSLRMRIVEKGIDVLLLAKELDESPFSGDMGLLEANSLREDLNMIAFGTSVGVLSEPVCDTTGCFLFYPLSKEKGDVASFEDLRPKLLEEYYAERFEREQQRWAEQAKRRSTIDVKLQKLP